MPSTSPTPRGSEPKHPPRSLSGPTLATFARLTLLLIVAAFGPNRLAEAAEPIEAVPADRGAAAPLPAGKVAAVALSPQPYASDAYLLDLLEIREGDVLERRAIRASIENLYATGRFHTIEVDAQRGPNGIMLRFELTPARTVESVSFSGTTGLTKGKLRKGCGIAPGDPFTPALVARGAERIRGLLRDNGYMKPSVSYVVASHGEQGGQEITFDVNSGPLYHVEKLPIETQGDLLPQNLRPYMSLEPGDPYLRYRLRRDMERIRSLLKHLGYPLATVSFEEKENAADALVVPIVTVTTGPSIAIQVVGDPVSEKDLATITPLIEGRTPGLALAQDAAARLEQHLHSEGFIDASVTGRWEPGESGSGTAVFEVQKGSKYTVNTITFEGGGSVPIKTLKRALATKEKSIPSYALSAFSLGYVKPGTFNPLVLDSDKQALIELYHGLGFMDVRITGPRIEKVEGEAAVDVVFGIDEGPVVTVGNVAVRGNTSLSTERLLEAADLGAGSTFNEDRAREAGDRILREYAKEGFAQAKVSLSTRRSGTTMNCTFEVTEGPRSTIHRILVNGNERTKTKVILRELDLKDGELLDPLRLFARERVLYRMGLFRKVHVKDVPAGIGGNARNVLVDLEEMRPYAVTYGLGFDSTELLRGILEFSNDNVRGTGRSLGMATRIGRLESRVRLYRRNRWFLGTRTLSTLTGFRSRTDQESFIALRTGISMQLRRSLTPALTGTVRYEFRDVALRDLQVAPETLEPEDREITLGSVLLSLVHDTRDNPVEPSEGSLIGGNMEVALPWMGSSHKFIKSSFRAFVFKELADKVVLAAGARADMAFPFNDTESLPLSERFFAGGSTTVRSVPRNYLGPLDPVYGTPLGGDARMILNGELRVPLMGPVGAVAFVDAGNVYESVRKISLSKMEVAIGAGLRVKTPVGPIRFDYGFSPAKNRSEYFISVGQAF